jgi:hypothetical protein
LLGAACAAALLATGCAASSSTAAGKAGAADASAAGNPQQRAEADASAILAAFVPPPGARRAATAPRLPGGWEQHPESSLVSDSMVDEAAFWEAPGDPQSLLSWEQARLTGKRFTLGDADFGPPSWDREFDLPAAGVLTTRELIVEVVGAGNGQTAIRLDADVAWQPSRPASDLVPATARVVTLSEVAVVDTAPKLPAPVTITDASAVRQLMALVNGLPLSTIGAAFCPAPISNELVLTFRASPGGPVLATAQGPGDCGTVQLTIRGKEQPALQPTDSFTQNALTAAGVHWIRIAGQVYWQPPRPASDLVPATARVVTLSEVAVVDWAPKPPAPVTITDASAVRQLMALVNGLPLSILGGLRCPPPVSKELELVLTFRASPGGLVLATAQGPGDCETVQLTIRGKEQPALQITDSFTQNALAAAGLHWPVP